MCNTAQLTLHIDTHEATLEFLVKKVLKGRLGFNQPSIVQGSNFLYEEGEDAEESLAENLPLMLDMCPGGGLVDGSLITVEDFSQELTVLVLLRHRDNASFAENPEDAVASDLFLLGGSVTAPSLPAEGQPTTSGSTAQTSNASAVDSSGDMVMDEDDLVFVSDTSAPDTAVSSTATGKRSRSKDDEGEEEVEVEEEDPTKKKQRC